LPSDPREGVALEDPALRHRNSYPWASPPPRGPSPASTRWSASPTRTWAKWMRGWAAGTGPWPI